MGVQLNYPRAPALISRRETPQSLRSLQWSWVVEKAGRGRPSKQVQIPFLCEAGLSCARECKTRNPNSPRLSKATATGNRHSCLRYPRQIVLGTQIRKPTARTRTTTITRTSTKFSVHPAQHSSRHGGGVTTLTSRKLSKGLPRESLALHRPEHD